MKGCCKDTVCLEHQISISGTWNLGQEVLILFTEPVYGSGAWEELHGVGKPGTSSYMEQDTNIHTHRNSVILEYMYAYRWTEQF